YRRHVYCGPSDRGHGTHYQVRKLAHQTLRRDKLWWGYVRTTRGRLRNKPDEQCTDGCRDDVRIGRYPTRRAGSSSRFRGGYYLWLRSRAESDDRWFTSNGTMATDPASAGR